MRVGILTSGGDCQSLNATMRGVAKTLYNLLQDDVEIIGFVEGYKGLIYSDYRIMKGFFRDSDGRRNDSRNKPPAVQADAHARRERT